MTPRGTPEGFDAALLEESPEELYEQAPCGYISTFPDGTFARVNGTFLAWTGYDREELLAGKRIQDLLTTGSRIYYETHLTPLLHMQGFVNEIALDLVCRDGLRLPVLVNCVQKRGADGSALLHRTTLFNASDRRTYERELLRARQEAEQAAARLDRLLRITTAFAKALTRQQVAQIITEQGVSALDARAGLVGVLTDDGRGLEIIYAIGYSREILERWGRFSLDAALPLADAIRTGEPVLLESPDAMAAHYPQLATLLDSSGTQSIVAIPLSTNGGAVGVLGMSFSTAQSFTADDRTFLLMLARQCALALERAQLYEAEQTARAAAQEAVQARDTFFSVASHELKNPLTALLGNAQLLQRRLHQEVALSDRNQRMLGVIVEQAGRLNKLIAEMLDVGRIASGHLALTREPMDVVALAERVVAEVQPTLTDHTLVFDRLAPSLVVDGDAVRLEQVLQNLLQNAIKYSPEGGSVAVRVERQGHLACLAVTDQGIGIAPEDLPRLFQRFYRAEHESAGGIAGLGIGLYVVKEIVSLHDGTIDVQSALGGGSTFTVRLPLAARVG